MESIPLTFHSDPGHGWLAIPLALYHKLPFNASRYSYISHKTATVYLEEDCDASKAIDAMTTLEIPHTIAEVSHNGDCFIRSLPHITVMG